jgi:hypothetical protein
VDSATGTNRQARPVVETCVSWRNRQSQCESAPDARAMCSVLPRSAGSGQTSRQRSMLVMEQAISNLFNETTKEEKYVVKPLIRWFRRQEARWTIRTPGYGTSERGWDIEARRKNQDLLIEAKYIDGPFLSSFSGLVAAPLASRVQHFMRRETQSWPYRVCWAIGTPHTEDRLYQILLDYLARNLKFWGHYHKELRVEYVFFVRRNSVARVRFRDLILVASTYAREVSDNDQLHYRRSVADHLLGQRARYQ